MNKREHFWTILQEECAEIIHIVSKIKRFGMADFHPDTGDINIFQLRDELNDLYACFELLTEEDVPSEVFIPDRERIEAKKSKVRQFLSYSRDKGTLND